jgi:ATP-dependent Zn protease
MPQAWLNTLISVAPFLLILLLWFFLLRNMKKGGGTNSYSNSIRQAVRDELAPELQALRQSVDAMRKDLNDRR